MTAIAGAPAAGRSNRTRKPPEGRFAAAIEPPCSSTIFLAIASPRPVPPLRAEKYGSKRRGRISGATPGPLSSTMTSIFSPTRRAPIRMTPPPASASTELPIRLARTRASRRPSPRAIEPGGASTSSRTPGAPE